MHRVRLNHAALMALTKPRAPGASAAKLLSSVATRWASTFSPSPARHQSERGSKPRKASQSRGPRSLPRMLSPDVAKFMRSGDGHLTTTPANARFFREHPTVEHDHGTMTHLDSASAAVRRLAGEYNVWIAWSPRHVLHPHRLRYLDPRGHPLAPKVLSECARKTRETALWAFATASGGVSAVVWQLTKRELLRAVFKSLAARGYDEHGRKADGTEIHGTLWLTVWRPQHARRLPADRFGEVVADALDQHCATRPEERRTASMADVGGAERGDEAKKELSSRSESRTNNAKQWRPRERSESLADNAKQWKPRERSDGRVRKPAVETEVQSTWQPRKRK